MSNGGRPALPTLRAFGHGSTGLRTLLKAQSQLASAPEAPTAGRQLQPPPTPAVARAPTHPSACRSGGRHHGCRALGRLPGRDVSRPHSGDAQGRGGAGERTSKCQCLQLCRAAPCSVCGNPEAARGAIQLPHRAPLLCTAVRKQLGHCFGGVAWHDRVPGGATSAASPRRAGHHPGATARRGGCSLPADRCSAAPGCWWAALHLPISASPACLPALSRRQP